MVCGTEPCMLQVHFLIKRHLTGVRRSGVEKEERVINHPETNLCGRPNKHRWLRSFLFWSPLLEVKASRPWRDTLKKVSRDAQREAKTCSFINLHSSVRSWHSQTKHRTFPSLFGSILSPPSCKRKASCIKGVGDSFPV